MPKLHELLAVEKSVENSAKKLVQHSEHTFGKENLFQGVVKDYRTFDESQSHLNFSEERKLETTVDENLDYLKEGLVKWLDVVFTKDRGNQAAVADIQMEDGTVLASQVPATFLLGLEAKLNSLRSLYLQIPTMQPGVAWIPDMANEKANVFVTASPQETFKTEKDMDFRVVVEPTEHHPAQIREVQKTVNVGKYTTTIYNGMLAPVEKARRIENIDKLLIAVRKARARANEVQVEKSYIGESIMDFINN